ncbi:MAG TPA: endo-1,4-beta-xylanase [Povalibacter sp.]
MSTPKKALPSCSTRSSRRSALNRQLRALSIAVAVAALSPNALGACQHVVRSEWGTGYVGAIVITNPTSVPINGWSVSWRYATNRVTSAWNANLSGSNPYTATSLSWNGSIPPGQSVEFGFQANKNGGAAEQPTVSGAACAVSGPTPPPTGPINVPGLHTLAAFPIGVAVNAGNEPRSLLRNDARGAAERAAVERHFDSLTPGNIMKMSYLHPEQNTFTFAQADELVNYARAHALRIHGHTLVWHADYQIPNWMRSYSGNWNTMLQSHVRTIVARYAGRIGSWDVVNEAFADDGDATAVNGYRNSLFLQKMGPGYIQQAFIAARAADPNAVLYYNDYNIEAGQQKFTRVLAMVDDFKARNIPIDGIGMQMHINIEWPSTTQIKDAMRRVVQRGLKVRISELDIPVNTFANPNRYATFTAEAAQRQEAKYREVVAAYLEVVPANLRGGITVWGLYDSDSWLIALYGRPDWPLILNDELQNKPATRGFASALTGVP